MDVERNRPLRLGACLSHGGKLPLLSPDVLFFYIAIAFAVRGKQKLLQALISKLFVRHNRQCEFGSH